MSNITVLKPVHTSPETAFIIDDYPYGFRLRCKKRVWLEEKKGKFRLVEQTTNPKVAGEVWNKPAKSTYRAFVALYIDHDDHDYLKCWSAYTVVNTDFVEYADGLTDNQLGRLWRVYAANGLYSLRGIELFDAVNAKLDELGKGEYKFH